MISAIIERPAIYKIRFDEIDGDTERRVLSRWAWNKLSEVVACLNAKKRGIIFTGESVIRNFAALNGNIEGIAVITCVVIKKRNHHYAINMPVDSFRPLEGEWKYLIPAGWGNRITDPHMDGLAAVELEIKSKDSASSRQLFGINSHGQRCRKLSKRFCPEIKSVGQEP